MIIIFKAATEQYLYVEMFAVVYQLSFELHFPLIFSRV